MPIAVIIDWYGPFKCFDEFKKHVKYNWFGCDRCVYLALGPWNVYNYIGLTSRPYGRFQNHAKMACPDNKKFFMGEIVTQGISGRRIKKTSPDMNLAESALISCLQPRFNDRKKFAELEDCVSIYSRFFSHEDFETPYEGLPKFPRHIGYNSWTGKFETASPGVLIHTPPASP